MMNKKLTMMKVKVQTRDKTSKKESFLSVNQVQQEEVEL